MTAQKVEVPTAILPTVVMDLYIADDHARVSFDPSTVTLPEAWRLRPQVDSAIRALRLIALFLDSLIENDAPRRATEAVRELKEREA